MTEAVAVHATDEGSVGPVGDLIARLFLEPEIEQIRIHQDPRFAWVPPRLPWRHAHAANLKVAVKAWYGLRPQDEQLRQLLVHLIAYTSDLGAATLEEELFSIVAPVLADQPEAVEGVLARFGWDGGAPRDAGQVNGVFGCDIDRSHEVFLQHIAHRVVWTPVLDRALAAIERRSPLPANQVGRLLHEAGMCSGAAFDPDGLLRAQEVFGKKSGLTIIEDGGERWVVSATTHELPREQGTSTRDVSAVETALTHAIKEAPPEKANGLSVAYTAVTGDAPVAASPEVRKRIWAAYDLLAHAAGIVEVSELTDFLRRSGVAMPRTQLLITLNDLRPLLVLQGRWVALIGTKRESILTKRLRQLLSVRNRLSLDVVKTQLARATPDYERLPVTILRAFIDAHPDFSLDGDHLWSPARLLPKTELDDAERFIFEQVKSGPKTREQIDAAVKQRPRLSGARVLEALRGSVIVALGTDGRYALVKDIPAPVTAPSEPASAPQVAPEPTPPSLSSQKSLGQASAEERLGRLRESPPEAVTPAPTPMPQSDVASARGGDVSGSAESHTPPARANIGTTRESAATIAELIRFVREGRLVLPEIQRGYVWKRTQVRDLLDSLYRGFPVGTMLIWETDEQPVARAIGRQHAASPTAGPRSYLLDGQQRLTSLSQLMDEGAPDIRFNLKTEEFRVGNTATRGNGWVSVSDIFRRGAAAVLSEIGKRDHPEAKQRIARLEQGLQRRVPLHQLKNFSYEDVTEIFIRVNSKGTRLKTAELAIAELAFRLPGLVTNELRGFADALEERGWNLESSLLLRCLTAVTTNQVTFPGLSQATEDELRDGWWQTRQALEQFLSLIEQRLGIHSIDWLTSTVAFVIPVVYFTRVPQVERDEHALLRWFLLANARSRYSGATETALAQDLKLLTDDSENPFPPLVERIRQASGRIEVAENELDGALQGSPLFLLSFLAMRMQRARDWWTGEEMRATNLGPGRLLELHHIFPRAAASRANGTKAYNEIANLAFLARPAPRAVTTSSMVDYLLEIQPARLRQQFVPERTGDWQPSRFSHFLQKRRRLLAAAINEVLATDW